MRIRLCQTALVAAVAVLMGLVTFNNLVAYGDNWAFVRHVTAMDSIFPGSDQRWRALTSEPLQRLAYAAIIAVEAACTLLLAGGAVRLARAARSATAFRAALPTAVVGLTLVLLLYGVGFLAVGGEWFLMWQSANWNGTESAGRYFLVAAAVLIILMARAPED